MSAIVLDDLHFSYPPAIDRGPAVEVLRGLTLEVPSGQAVAIMGPTSSGKTTLALIWAGLAPEMTGGVLRGQVQVDGLDAAKTPAAQLSSHLGLVFQEPERQLFNMTVADEVAFGLEGLAVPPAEIATRVTWALERVGLGDPDLLDRAPWQLSGGQQKRLAIASILALKPPILLLDEPMAGLDPQGRSEVGAVLRELKDSAGATVIVVEKDAEFVARWAERVVVLDEGRIVLDGSPADIFREVDRLHGLGVAVPQAAELAARLRAEGEEVAFLTVEEAAGELAARMERGGRVPQRMEKQRMGERQGEDRRNEDRRNEDRRSEDRRSEEPVEATRMGVMPLGDAGMAAGELDARDGRLRSAGGPPSLAIDVQSVGFVYEGGTRALDGLSLAVPAGQFVALVGPNGGGKSTLARHLNGLLRPQSGSVTVNGRPAVGRAVGDLAREVGYVFQNPDHQIFAPTVREEIAFGPRNLGLKGDPLARRVGAALATFGLDSVAEIPPAVLGYGQRRLVTVASVWAMQPPIWVLDEPTTGLDARITAQLMACLRALHRAGHTILLITHDMRLVAQNAERVVVVDRGRIVLDGPSASVLADAGPLARIGLRPPPITRLSAALAPYGFPHLALTVDQFVAHWTRNDD